MSHWMTSGRTRLKAKEDRSFAQRAQSRATFMGYKSKSRKRNTGPREVQQSHPRFHKRTAMQDLGSSWPCPIARRGIVAVSSRPAQRGGGKEAEVGGGREGGDDDEKGNGASSVPAQPERRIRDAKAFQQSSKFVNQKNVQQGSYRQQNPFLLAEYNPSQRQPQRQSYLENLQAQAQQYSQQENQLPRRKLLAPIQNNQQHQHRIIAHPSTMGDDSAFLQPQQDDVECNQYSGGSGGGGEGWDDFQNNDDGNFSEYHDRYNLSDTSTANSHSTNFHATRDFPVNFEVHDTPWNSAPLQQSYGQDYDYQRNDETQYDEYCDDGDFFDNGMNQFQQSNDDFHQPEAVYNPMSPTTVSNSTGGLSPTNIQADFLDEQPTHFMQYTKETTTPPHQQSSLIHRQHNPPQGGVTISSVPVDFQGQDSAPPNGERPLAPIAEEDAPFPMTAPLEGFFPSQGPMPYHDIDSHPQSENPSQICSTISSQDYLLHADKYTQSAPPPHEVVPVVNCDNTALSDVSFGSAASNRNHTCNDQAWHYPAGGHLKFYRDEQQVDFHNGTPLQPPGHF